MAKKDDVIAEALRLNLIKNKTEGKSMLVADLEQMIANATKVSPMAMPGMEDVVLDAADPIVAPVNGHCASCGEADVPLDVAVSGPRAGEKLCGACLHGEPIDAAAELIGSYPSDQAEPSSTEDEARLAALGVDVAWDEELVHERVGGPEFPDRGNLRMPALDITHRITELENKLIALRGQPNTRQERIALNRGIRRLEARLPPTQIAAGA